jgi:hypothetical protein
VKGLAKARPVKFTAWSNDVVASRIRIQNQPATIARPSFWSVSVTFCWCSGLRARLYFNYCYTEDVPNLRFTMHRVVLLLWNV